MSKPAVLLKEFSLLTDHHLFFRQFAFVSMVMGLLLIPYLLVYGLVRFLLRFVSAGRLPTAAVSILAAVLSVALIGLGLYNLNRTDRHNPDWIMTHLDQAGWQDRVALLQHITATGGEVKTLPVYEDMLASPYVAERYWLAKALGQSRRPETFADLLRLLYDSQPNVVCMAFLALGQRGESLAIKDIIARILSSDHWYEQWYGYRALRNLGWRQQRMK